MPSTPKNFNLQRELDERDDVLDWKFGALSKPALVSIPLDEREPYLPKGETQFDAFTDFTDCASRSPVNHLEAVFTYHYLHNMLPENKKWFEDNSYVQNGKITFSDRYIAILSGTTHEGNSLKSPLEAIRTQGLIPKKLLPKEDWMKWEDYYDSSKITPFLKALGQEFRARFKIEYEQVAQVHFADVLKDDMLGVAGFAWPAPVNGVYPPSDGGFNHAFLIYNLPQWQIFDNYLNPVDNSFDKNLSPFYKFYDYGYRVYIAKEQLPAPPGQTLYEQLAALLAKIAALLQSSPPKPPSTPAPVPIPTPPLPKSKIQMWALAIQHEEGGNPQNLNMRLHNPGNLKFTAYTQSLGAFLGPAGTDGGSFCQFKTYDAGFKALCQFLTDAANDLLIPYHDPKYRTLKGFTQRYANPPANHPYAENVAAALGVPVNIQIKSLLTGFSSVDNSFASNLSANTINGMSTQVIAVIINMLVMVLPFLGVNVGTVELTTTVQTIVALATGAWIWYQRTKLQEAPDGIGDVNFAGVKKN